jgi:hypothetical protein
MKYGTAFLLSLALFGAPNAKEFERDGATIIRGVGEGEYGTAALDFKQFLLPLAPLIMRPGLSLVDGRLKGPIASAHLLVPALLVFAKVFMPSMFPDSLSVDDIDASLIWLTLLSSSRTQDNQADYTHSDSHVFIFYLEDGDGSTEWTLHDGRIKMSDAKGGDTAVFKPSLIHRGMKTGFQRRAVYVSIRRKMSCADEKADIAAFKARSPGISVFSQAVYDDAVEGRI